MATKELLASDVQEFASLALEKDRKNFMTIKLGLENVDLEDDLRSSCLVDFYCENTSFAVESGFSWRSSLEFVQMMVRVLQKTAATDRSLVFAVKTVEEELKSEKWTWPVYQRVSGRLFESFLQHYALYRYVFTREREEKRDGAVLTFDRPVTGSPLKEGVEESVWLKREEERAKEKVHEEKLKSINVEKNIRERVVTEMKQSAFQDLDLSENVQDVVAKAIGKRGKASQHLLESSLDISNALIGLKMERLASKLPDTAPPLDVKANSKVK